MKAILVHLGFWPRMVETVSGRTPPAVVSRADRNRATKERGFARVAWNDLTLIRGVELWVEDEGMLNDYSWEVVAGGPAVSEVQCPVRSGEQLPGEYNVTYYQQIKGHWLWAMFKDESTGLLTVKWVRGKCPPGGRRWPQEQHQ